MLCDTKGIVYNFEIYSGRINPVAGYEDLGASSNIVIQLAQVIQKQQIYLLYFDNWFTSLKLLIQHTKDAIFSLGTERQNRLPGCQLSSDTEQKKKKEEHLKKKKPQLMEQLFEL